MFVCCSELSRIEESLDHYSEGHYGKVCTKLKLISNVYESTALYCLQSDYSQNLVNFKTQIDMPTRIF